MQTDKRREYLRNYDKSEKRKELKKNYYKTRGKSDHRKEWEKEWRRSHPDKLAQYRKTKIEKGRDKINAQKKDYYQRNREKIRERLRIKYQERKAEILSVNAKWREENKDKLKLLRRIPERVYNQRKLNAKGRDIPFNLSKEEFLEFWNLPCNYCGDPVSGACLDRIDNSKGYEVGNVAQCCRWCNVMKLDKTTDEFIDHCRKVVAKSENK